MGAGAGSACIGGGLALLAGGPAAPVEGSVAGPKEIHAQTGADRVRRPLQDAGRGQGGFAMESCNEIMVGVAVIFSNAASGPCDDEVRMQETSPQSSAFHLEAGFEFQITFDCHMPSRYYSTLVFACI